MPCWLLLLNDAGFPLFSRSYGLPSSAFSFPTMGLLSAIHSSAGNSGFAVTRITSHDAQILYRMFTGGLILVFSTSDIHMSDSSINKRMLAIYDALVFLIGRAKIQDLRNVERTKRQIRSAANLLSLFLVEDSYLLQMGTGAPECCIASNSMIFDHLRTIAEACHTVHAAFYAQHRLYTWTPEWISLDSRDLFTISVFLRSCTPAQARDVPVYLAHSSLAGGANGASNHAASQIGRTPYRLLTVALLHELELVLLCGPAPTLVDAVNIATRTIVGVPTRKQEFSTMHADLLAAAHDFPRHLPNQFSFHPSILGFVWMRHEDDSLPTTHSSNDSHSHPTRRKDRLVASFLSSIPSLPTPAASSSNAEKGRRSPSPLRKAASALSLSSSSRDAQQEPPSPSSLFKPNNPLFSGSLLSEATVLSRSHALLGCVHLLKGELEFNRRSEDNRSNLPTTNTTLTRANTTDAPASAGSPASSPSSSSSSTSMISVASAHGLLNRASTFSPGQSSPSPVAAPTAGSTLSSPGSASPVNVQDGHVIVSEAYMLTPNRGFYAYRRGASTLYVMFNEKVAQPQHGPYTKELLDKLEALHHHL